MARFQSVSLIHAEVRARRMCWQCCQIGRFFPAVLDYFSRRTGSGDASVGVSADVSPDIIGDISGDVSVDVSAEH